LHYKRDKPLNDPKSHKQDSLRSKVWQFVNTAFGIWFLSTIVLGFATWFYTRWSETSEIERIQTEQVKKLDTEIGARIQFAKLALAHDSSSNAVHSAVEELLHGSNRTVVFPEYRERGIVPLMWELSSLCPSESERCKILIPAYIVRTAEGGDLLTSAHRTCNLLSLLQKKRPQWGHDSVMTVIVGQILDDDESQTRAKTP
jgi:hypothetical protein